MQNKTNRPEKTISLPNLPNIMIAVIFIVGVGAVYGLIGYLFFGIKENVTPIIQKPSIEITNSYFGNEFIQIKSPQKNAVIKSPILISGKANVYEANVRVRISDDNKNILADDFITAGGWMDKLYLFEKEIDYKTPQTKNGLIEIFEESVKDGSDLYKVEVAVVFEEYKDISSDWEVYRNEKAGFYFKYPKEWGPVIHEDFYKPIFINGKLEIAGKFYTIFKKNLFIKGSEAEYNPWQRPLLMDYAGNDPFEYCKELQKNVFLLNGCSKINENMAIISYGYYFKQGMHGTGKEIFFRKELFMRNSSNKYSSLNVFIEFSIYQDDRLLKMNEDQIRDIANKQLMLISKDDIETFNQILSSFKFIEEDDLNNFMSDEIGIEENVVFDDCGELQKYEREIWYDNLVNIIKKMNRLNYYEAEEVYEINKSYYSSIEDVILKIGKVSPDNITDACLSTDNKYFIAIVAGRYGGDGFKLLRFDIEDSKIAIAKREDIDGGKETMWYKKTDENYKEYAESQRDEMYLWFVTPDEFGKREGNEIIMTGRSGDAGCLVEAVFKYNLKQNYIFITEQCSWCEGDGEENCESYNE